MQIPASLIEKIENVYGDRGRVWLKNLPELIAACRERWSLQLAEPFANLSYNLTIPATNSSGLELVLKLGVPCAELLSEAAALTVFDGVCAVRLEDHEADRGILLLERIKPGSPLYTLRNEAETTHVAATLMRKLWRPAPANHSFPSLTTWFRAIVKLLRKFDGGCGPLPAEMISKAQQTLSFLNAQANTEVVLHGDLHHENILYSEKRGWLAIDPKGILGEPGYEVGSFMLNQLPAGGSDRAITQTFKQRLSIFSKELGISEKRLAQWSFCHAVLSAVWNFEESADWRPTMKLALLLSRLAEIA